MTYSSSVQLDVISLIMHHYNFLERDLQINDLKKIFAPSRFAYEMGTIVFQGYRGFGHTRIAELLFDIYDPILIVTHNHMMAELIRRSLRTFYDHHKNKKKINEEIKDYVICIDQLMTMGYRPVTYGLPNHYFKMCVVDYASHLNQEQKDTIYDKLSSHVNMFTFLG